MSSSDYTPQQKRDALKRSIRLLEQTAAEKRKHAEDLEGQAMSCRRDASEDEHAANALMVVIMDFTGVESADTTPELTRVE